MPDSKITALTALTSADPANDMFPIVDVSDTSMAASGTTKRISINNLLAASGTATLASATITGDLTVDTSTLKVDSTNNRVGIGTASPASALDVYGETRVRSGNQLRVYRADNAFYSSFEDAGGGAGLTVNNFNGDGFLLKVASNSVYQVGSSYVQTWYDGAGGTRMTLNSTGLGVGVSPSYKLDVRGSDNSVIAQFGGTNRQVRLSTSAVSAVDNTSFNFIHTSGSGRFTFQNNSGTQTMLTIDDNGNNILRMPVTPPTLGVNFEGTFNLTSNTNLRISVRGSDGVTRVANITLA